MRIFVIIAVRKVMETILHRRLEILNLARLMAFVPGNRFLRTR